MWNVSFVFLPQSFVLDRKFEMTSADVLPVGRKPIKDRFITKYKFLGFKNNFGGVLKLMHYGYWLSLGYMFFLEILTFFQAVVYTLSITF